MKVFLITIAIFFGLVIVFGAIGEACHLLNTSTDSVNGVIDKTLDSNNVIYNYEYFHQANQDIRAMDIKIIDAKTAAKAFSDQFANRKDMDREDKTEQDRLNSIVLGLQQERQNMVATYNARSQMANRDIFKGNDLPQHIN